MDVREFYDHALSERGFKSDEAQQRAIDACSVRMKNG